MGWIFSVPLKFICQNPKPQDLRMWVFGNIVVVDVITYPDPMTGVLIKRVNLNS